MIFSATGKDFSPSSEIRRQIFYFVIGFLLLVLMIAIDYEVWGKIAYYLYILNILLLLIVLFAGKSAGGAQRWVSLGPLGTFQPSETSKIIVIITLARFLSQSEKISPKTFLLGLLHFGVPATLVLLQPDLGTALVFLTSSMVMMFVAGVPLAWLAGAAVCGLAAAPFFLREYQRTRLLVFLNPESDPEGAGWALIQSKIAIGSGQLWGKGIFSGTQNQLRFVPEHSTDFIFTVIGEELGLLGTLSVLCFFLYMLLQGLRYASLARDLFGVLTSVGIVIMFAFHMVVNIGMTLGIMPVTGIPLPFISYGGSSLLASMASIGLLSGIYMRRRPRAISEAGLTAQELGIAGSR